MGWTFMERPKGYSEKEWPKKELMMGDPVGRILDVAKVGNTDYVAFRTTEGKVTALIILTQWAPNDLYNWGYKDMDEAMGPFEYKAPRRILELLSPLEELYEKPADDSEGRFNAYLSAKEWREKAWAYQNRPRPKPGDTVTFAAPLKFTNGAELSEFTYEKGSRFRRGYSPYTITRWKEREYTVTPQEEGAA